MSLTNNRTFFKNFIPVVIKDSPIAGGSSSEIIHISINLTGTRLVNSRTDRSIRIWKCTPERLIDPVIIEHPHLKAVERVAWNPKTEFSFATVGRDDLVKIWRCTGSLEKELTIVKNGNTNGSGTETICQVVAYSNDGEILTVVDRDATVLLYSVSNNYAKLQEFQLNDHIYDILWFHHGHSFFMCALHDGSVPIYKITDVLLDANGSSQVNGSADTDNSNSITIDLKHKLLGHRSSATCVVVDPRGKYFAVGSNEGVVSLWNTSSMLISKVLTNTDEAIANIDISRDGTYVAVAYDSGENVKIFDYDTTEQVYEVPNSNSGNLALSHVAWFPSKTAFVHTSDNGRTMTLMKKPGK